MKKVIAISGLAVLVIGLSSSLGADTRYKLPAVGRTVGSSLIADIASSQANAVASEMEANRGQWVRQVEDAKAAAWRKWYGDVVALSIAESRPPTLIARGLFGPRRIISRFTSFVSSLFSSPSKTVVSPLPSTPAPARISPRAPERIATIVTPQQAAARLKAQQLLETFPRDANWTFGESFAPSVTLAARWVNDQVLDGLAPFGINMEGNVHPLIRYDEAGRFVSPFVGFVAAVAERRTPDVYKYGADLAQLDTEISCRDAIRFATNLDHKITDFASQMVAQGKSLVAAESFNAFLPAYVIALETAKTCRSRPSVSALRIPFPSADNPSRTLFEAVASQPNFSLTDSLFVRDVREGRLRQVRDSNPAALIRSAYLTEMTSEGSDCDLLEMSFSGEAGGYACPEGCDHPEDLMTAGSPSGGTDASAPSGGSSWAEGCRTSSSSAPGAGLGGLGQCFGPTIRGSRYIVPDSPGGTQLLRCVRQSVGGRGFAMNIQSPSTVGGPGCRISLTGYKDPDDGSPGPGDAPASVDATPKPEKPEATAIQMLAQYIPKESEILTVATAVAMEGVEVTGDEAAAALKLAGENDLAYFMISHPDATAKEGYRQLMESAVNYLLSGSDTMLPMMIAPGTTAPRSCDPEAGNCGSFACSNIPTVLSSFIQCMGGSDVTSVDPCAAAPDKCSDTADDMAAFNLSCGSHYTIADDGCSNVDCPGAEGGQASLFGVAFASSDQAGRAATACRCGGTSGGSASTATPITREGLERTMLERSRLINPGPDGAIILPGGSVTGGPGAPGGPEPGQPEGNQ